MDLIGSMHSAMNIGWIVFAVAAAVSVLPFVVAGVGRAFLMWIFVALGLPLVIVSLGLRPPVPAVNALGWLAAALIVMTLLAGLVPSQPVGGKRPAARRSGAVKR